MAGLQCIVGDGALIVFGGSPPANFTPPPTPTSAGDQPAAAKAQGYPQMRGFSVACTAQVTPDMGVSVDELTQ